LLGDFEQFVDVCGLKELLLLFPLKTPKSKINSEWKIRLAKFTTQALRGVITILNYLSGNQLLR